MNPDGIKLISFDCAQTLIRVNWHPVEHILACAAQAGAELEAAPSREILERLIMGRWREWQVVNLERSEAVCQEWWANLVGDWLEALHHSRTLVPQIQAISEMKMFGPESEVYAIFSDTLPSLAILKEAGYRLAILSNWDNSLHRTVRHFHLENEFEVVIASLEEGVEKPDPQLFKILCGRVGLGPEEIIHIGDSPLDDFQGALGAGMGAALLDRHDVGAKPPRFPTLTQFAQTLLR